MTNAQESQGFLIRLLWAHSTGNTGTGQTHVRLSVCVGVDAGVGVLCCMASLCNRCDAWLTPRVSVCEVCISVCGCVCQINVQDGVAIVWQEGWFGVRVC